MAKNIKISYAEPKDYFSEEIRREYNLGEYAKDPMLEKIKAVMLGHAVGDALGVPVEFCTREELAQNPVTDMMGWGSYDVPPGCWSDDTSMALATLDSLGSNRIDYAQIMNNFVAWYYRGEYTPEGKMFDIGGSCRAAIRRYQESDVKSPLECGLSDEHSNGNGSLMRIHPMALYLFVRGEEEKAAVEVIHKVSSLTHAHARSRIACGVYAHILWELLSSPRRASVLYGLKRAKKFYRENLKDSEKDELLLFEDEIFKLSEELPSDEKIESSGYVLDTLRAAIWCLLTSGSYEECVLKAVNLGEDTDTVAAVAGGLAGALYGMDAIPSAWLAELKKRDYIEKLCESAYTSWTAQG